MEDWGGPGEILGTPFDVEPAPERVARHSTNRHAQLSEILKRELLPRLLQRRQASAPDTRSETVAPADPEALARCLVSGRLRDARAAIAARLASGATANAVMFEDIAPAARRLGEFWRDDACDFFDVTLASGALRDMLRDVATDEPKPGSKHGPSILITTAPGETHQLGADVVAILFQHAGWRTHRCASGAVRSMLLSEAFDVAAFSVSCDRFADPLRRAVGAARGASRNRRLKILLGGPVFASNPQLGSRLGADLCASGADMAPQYPSIISRTLRL